MPKGRIIQAGEIKSTKIGTNEVTVVDECGGGAMPDRAETRAQKWLLAQRYLGEINPVWLDTTTDGTACVSSLAALLRAERERTLAEVEKVVESTSGLCSPSWRAKFLARLKAL